MKHKITIKNMSFNPQVLEIKKGDTVYWSNEDSMMHTASRDASPQFDTGEIPSEAESEPIEFNEISSNSGFDYKCRPHAFMRGAIKVTDLS